MNTRIITTALAASILAIPAIADAPGYFKVPGTETTMKVYGQMEMRYQYGLTGLNDVTTFPVDAVTPAHDQSYLRKGISQSVVKGRFGFTTTTPSSFGDINVKVEGQATSSETTKGASFNLRHAYGTIGGFLIGQTDSLYGSIHYEPNTLWGWIPDENANFDFARQVRYTFAPTKDIQLIFSIEDEKLDAESTGGTKRPTLVGGFTYGSDWGGVAVTIANMSKSDWTMTAGDSHTESATGTCYAVSGKWNITANDYVQAMINNAGGEFGTANDGFVLDGGTATVGDYKFYKSTAINVSYGHTWNEAFSSNVGIGQVTWKKDSDVGMTHKAKLSTFFVNSYWQAAKNVRFGAEYQYGQTKFSGVDAYIDKDGDAKSKNKDSQIRLHAFFTFF